MSGGIIDNLIRNQQQMEAERGTWEAHWEQIAALTLPRQRDFFTQTITPGEKRRTNIYDGTAELALGRFAAAVEGMITPRNQKWHKLKATNEDLNKQTDVKLWFDQITDILFQKRYAPTANFASQNNETYISLGAFGTGCLFIDEVIGLGLRYRAIHLAEIFIAENHAGQIDTIHRKFKMTARQIVQRWESGVIPEKIRITLEKDPERKFEILHCVLPNPDFDPTKVGPNGMKFSSFYISLEDRAMLENGGFRTFPYSVSRYVTAPRETYGRSPAMQVLPDIKMLNEMERSQIRAIQRATEPPLLLHDDGLLQLFSTRPNALNYGGIDAQGRQLVKTLDMGGRVEINEAKMQQKRELINDAFLVSLFQILVDTPTMTATEVLARAQEKGILLGPTLGRQQSEALGPQIEREVDILATAGGFPPMPEALIEAEGEFSIVYDSPLSRAQKAEEGQGVLRTIESLTPFALIDPTVYKIFNVEEIARLMGEINGVPTKVLRSPEELVAIAEQEQEQELAQAAPQVADTLKTISEIQPPA